MFKLNQAGEFMSKISTDPFFGPASANEAGKTRPIAAGGIHMAALATKTGMCVEERGGMIFPHLANVEGLNLAAQAFDRDAAKLSCCTA